MKKVLKNKLFVLVIAVIVLSLVYYGVEKVIDDYSFYDNEDVRGEEAVDDFDSGVQFDEDEVDFVLEETESGEENESESVDVGSSSGEEVDAEEDSSAEIEGNAAEDGDTENKIYVYITGEVVVPGVVILDEGSRISDAINAAGGSTANANVSKVNLVYVLQDGMKVNIPSNSDLKINPDFEYITTASGDGRNDMYSANSVTSSQNATSKVQEIVNINTATQTELESLPGIGPSLALKIINYRKENGSFSSIEDIKNVSGIGESKFEALKEFIRV